MNIKGLELNGVIVNNIKTVENETKTNTYSSKHVADVMFEKRHSYTMATDMLNFKNGSDDVYGLKYANGVYSGGNTYKIYLAKNIKQGDNITTLGNVTYTLDNANIKEIYVSENLNVSINTSLTNTNVKIYYPNADIFDSSLTIPTDCSLVLSQKFTNNTTSKATAFNEIVLGRNYFRGVLNPNENYGDFSNYTLNNIIRVYVNSVEGSTITEKISTVRNKLNTTAKILFYEDSPFDSSKFIGKIVTNNEELKAAIETEEIITLQDYTDIIISTGRDSTSLENTVVKKIYNNTTISTIDDYAFYNFGALEEVDLTNITDIGNYAFSITTNLKTVKFNSSVTLMKCSFSNSGFEEVKFNDVELNENSLYSILNLKRIYIDGVFNYDSTSILTDSTTVYYNPLKTNLTNLKNHFGSSCKYVGKCVVTSDSEFSTAVTNGATDIIINFPKQGTLTYYISSSNTILKTVVCNENVIGFSDNCFYRFTALESVECKNITSIGTYCFYNCLKLNYISPLDNLTSLGNHAFYSCERIKNISINNLTTIGDYAFYGCISLTNVNCNNATTIGNYAFYNCFGLEKFVGKNVTTINSYTFAFSSSNILPRQIDIPNIKVIGNYTFYNSCYEVDINGIEELGVQAFGDRIIPAFDTSNLKVLHVDAFKYVNMETIESNVLETIDRGGATLTYVKTLKSTVALTFSAFSLTSFENIYLPNCLITDNFLGNAVLKEISLLFFLDGNTDFFKNCSSLETVRVDILTKLSVFNGTDGVKVFYRSLSELGTTTATNLEIIQIHAVNFDKNYETLITKVNRIGCEVGNNTELQTILESTKNIYSIYLSNFATNYILTSENTNVKKIVCDDSIEIINNYAFYEFTSLEEFVGKNVKSVGKGAFKNCSKLTSVDLPLITEYSESIFENCYLLNISKLITSIKVGPRAFKNNTQIQQIELYKDVGEEAFMGCSAINTVRLNYCSIGDRAFMFCESIVDLYLTGVDEIGKSAFDNCVNLNSVVFDGSVINSHAFDSCYNLQYVDLGENIKTLYDGIFTNCSNLKYVVMRKLILNVLGKYADKFISGISINSTVAQSSLVKEYFDGNINIVSDIQDIPEPLPHKSVTIDEIIDDYKYYNKGTVSIDFTKVKKIGRYAFYGCTISSDVNLDIIEYIDEYAFYGCTISSDVRINYTIKYMGDNAFGGLTSATNIKFYCDIFSFTGNIGTPKTNLTLYVNKVIEDLSYFDDCNKTYTSEVSTNDSLKLASNGVAISSDYKTSYIINGNTKTINSADISAIIISEKCFESDTIQTLNLDEVVEIKDYAFSDASILEFTSATTRDIKTRDTTISGTVSADTALPGDTINGNIPGTVDENSSIIGDITAGDATLPGDGGIINGNITIDDIVTVKRNTIPNVKEIGYKSFANCSCPEIILFPNLKTLGSYAFDNMQTLVEISLGNVEIIPKYAFNNCIRLRTITCDSVTEIQSYAFNNCFNLKKFYSRNLSIIRSYAFNGCGSLSKILLPRTLTLLEENAFEKCSSLTEINLCALSTVNLSGTYATNSYLTNVNILYRYISTTEYQNNIKSYFNVDTITPCIFSTSVDIPYITNTSVIIIIDDYESDNFSTNIKFDNVSEIIFEDKYVTKLNCSIDCSKLKIFYGNYIESINSMYNNALFESGKLSTINLPSLKYLGRDSFKKYVTFSLISLGNCNDDLEIEGNAFYSTTATRIKIYSNNITFSGTSSIKKVNYIDLSALSTDYTYSSAIQYFGITNCFRILVDNNETLAKCNLKEELELSNFTEPLKYYGIVYSSLTTLTIKGISVIPPNMFKNSTALTTVVLEDVTIIEENAFYGCSNLTSVKAPKLRILCANAFNGCVKFDINDLLNSSNIVELKENSLDGLTLTSLTLPSNISTAFSNTCYNTGLTSIEFKSNTVRFNAFPFNAPNLKKITFRAVNPISTRGSFNGCANSWNDVIYKYAISNKDAEQLKTYCGRKGKYYAIIVNNNELNRAFNDYVEYLITEYEGETIVKNTENTVGKRLKGIVLDSTITDIEKNCFKDFNNLTSFSGIGIKNIEEKAFYNCSSLNELSLQKVENIGNYAFYNCSSLISLYIYNAASLGLQSFFNCSKLDTVYTSSLTSIGEQCFARCYNLYTIKIPSIKNLEAEAFIGCNSLKWLELPSSLTSIDTGVCSGCSGLNSVSFDSNNAVNFNGKFVDTSISSPPTYALCVSGGITDTTKLSNIYNYFDSRYKITDNTKLQYAINNFNMFSTEYINSGSTADTGRTEESVNLYSCNKIVLDSNIKAINSYAFYKCRNLTSLYAHSLTEIPIAYCRDCVFLRDVNIPSTATKIGNYGFMNCGYLINIDLNKIRYIDTRAFSGCNSLTSITFPSTVTYLHGAVLENCTRLTSIYVNINNVNFDYASTACLPTDKEIRLYINRGITDETLLNKIRTYFVGYFKVYNDSTFTYACNPTNAFYSINTEYTTTGAANNGRTSSSPINDSLVYVALDSKITSINTYAFANCNKLTYFYLGGLKTASNYMFSNCTSLTNLDFQHVETFGNNVFENCVNLHHVIFPTATTKVLSNTITGCTSLKGISFNSKDDSCTFTGTAGLTSGLICPLYTNPDTSSTLLSKIRAYFTGYYKITNDTTFKVVCDPNNDCYCFTTEYTTKGAANNGRTASSGANNSAISICLDSNITTINSYAFNKYQKLIRITCKGLTALPNYFINGASNLTYLATPSITNMGDYSCSNCTDLTTFSAPNLTNAGNFAFANCYNLSSLSVTNLTKIGIYSCSNCSKLSSFTATKLTNIGNYSFSNCSNLSSLSTPAIINIGDYGCSNCSKLSSFTATKLTNIGNYSFSNCSNLGSLSTPAIINMGDYSCSNCVVLTEFSAPDLTYAGNFAFSNCYNLNSVSIPKITNIKYMMFRNCLSLKSLVIPSTVTSIGSWTFDGCSSLTSIDYKPTSDFGMYNYASMNKHNFDKLTITCSSALTNIKKYFHKHWAATVTTNTDFNSKLTSITSLYLDAPTSLSVLTTDRTSSIVASSKITEICLNKNITKISNNYAFYNLTGLTKFVTIGSLNIPSFCFNKDTALKEFTGEAVTVLGPSAFYGCSTLNYVRAEKLASIDYSCFSNCTSLTAITIPSSIVYLGRWPFNNCKSLKSVTYNANKLTDAKMKLFAGTDISMFANLTNLSFGSGVSDESKELANIYFHKSWAGKPTTQAAFTTALTSLSSVYVNAPSTLVTLTTGRTSSSAANTTLKYLFINTYIASLGNTYSFYNMTNLRKMVCTGNKFTVIPEGMCMNCSNLIEAYVVAATTISKNAFKNCSNLLTLYLGTQASIGDYALSGCTTLTSFGTTTALKTIGSYTYEKCIKLASLNLSSCSSIGTNAFKDCSALSALTLGTTYTAIGTSICSNCTSLKNIYYKPTTLTYTSGTYGGPTSNVTITYSSSLSSANLTKLKSYFGSGNTYTNATSW